MAEARYRVLARKWRPQRFEDVVGQEHITRTLRNAIASGRIHHAFLFLGSRGIGKTTTARLLAKALNCLEFDAPTTEPCGRCDNCTSIGEGMNMDVLEIDGASNNSVDDVREIRENVRMMPSNARYKVYIIDEVHQLSSAAFNALLKTLEEPPEHAIFILATTEAHRIPATIVSRCQRYDFRRVGMDAIVELLRDILEAEGLKATDEALHAIARAAEGGVRDAESILDELITYCDGEIAYKDVYDVLGLVDWKVLHTLCDAILEKDIGRLLTLVEEIVSGGKDLSQFVQEVLRYFRNLLVCKTAKTTGLLHLPEDECREIEQHAAKFPLTALIRLVEQFAELTSGFDSQLAQRIALEAVLIRISKVGVEVSVDTVIEKLVQLGAGGVAPPPGGSADPPEAGPAPVAPPVPARRKRSTAGTDDLSTLWPALLDRIRKDRLNLGISLGQATPSAIDGAVLCLQFDRSGDHARALVEERAGRAVIESALCEASATLKTFRTELVETAPPEPPPAAEEDTAFYPTADPEAARAALEDPAIAKLMDVFKGRIADVKPARGADT